MSAALWLAFVLSSCREIPGRIELPPLPKERLGTAGAPPIPDGTTACASDQDCDDGIACTRDVCLPGGYCISAGDSSRCSDGVFCNGEEVCDPSSGCLPGSHENCNDDDICTIDSCDESQKTCVHGPRDFDGDGEADWHCAGGTDCDDFDPTRGSLALEICADTIDNDCDNKIDEADCGQPQHDRCDDALDVSQGGRVRVSLAGATPDYASSCSSVSARDVVFTFTTTEPNDVTLIASGVLSDGGNETAALSLRTECADGAGELKCGHGFPGQVRVRALPAGTYFVIVSSEQAVQVVLETRFDPPSQPPSNTTCDSPLDVSAGGHFEGNFVDAGDDEQLACGFMGSEDLVYSFTTQQVRDVELSATSLSGGRMSFAVRGSCRDSASSVRCVSDAPARARLYQLPAGTYYLVLEGPASREVDFGLDVAFLPPTTPPPGDGCGNPLELPIETEVHGALANRQDLVDLACGCDPSQQKQACSQFLPDVVYHVKVDAATDLGVNIDGGTSLMIYGFRSTCDVSTTQLACGDGTIVAGRVRNVQPGDYYVILESPAPASDPANFKVSLDRLPRTIPTSANGNDTCASAIDIPDGGALFTGDTFGMLDDYQALCGGGAHSPDATFRVVLPKRSRVTASLEATFDTVLYRFNDTGNGAASCRSKNEAACNDDGAQGNTNSMLSDVLDAGTYYYVVDGFNDNSQGTYLLDVTIVAQ